MRFMMCSAIVVLVMVNNYSFAANKCEALFKTQDVRSSKSTLSLKTEDELILSSMEKKYPRSDVHFLSENIKIIKNLDFQERGGHMRLIRALEKESNLDFPLMIQKSKIIIEYMVTMNYLRDVSQNSNNPKDAFFSSYVKALYFSSLNAMKEQTEGRSEKVKSRLEKTYIREWASLRGHLYDVVTEKFGTVIFKGNIIHFLFKNLEELRVKLELPDVEHRIRLATLRDIAKLDKLLGNVHVTAIKNIAQTSYRINNVFKVDETLEAFHGIVSRTDRRFTENLNYSEKQVLASSIFGLMNLFHKKSPSAQSLEIIERARVFASNLQKQRAYTQSQQESFKIDEAKLFKLNVEAFIEQVEQYSLSKSRVSELVVRYVKKKGTLNEEEYYLLNELNITYKAIDELEKYFSPLSHL